jgi:hypothetical protein
MNAARIREGNLLRADRVATAHKVIFYPNFKLISYETVVLKSK